MYCLTKLFFYWVCVLAIGAASLTTFGAQVPPLWCLPVPPVMVSPFGQAMADAVAKLNTIINTIDNYFFMISSLYFKFKFFKMYHFEPES